MPLEFDRVYSHHFERVMHSGAKQYSRTLCGALRCGYRRSLRPGVKVRKAERYPKAECGDNRFWRKAAVHGHVCCRG